VLNLLGQQPPRELEGASIAEFWAWAVHHWNIKKVPTANVKIVID